MADLSSIITATHPGSNAIGIIVTDQIWILFDREIDEESIKASLFVEGPDTDSVIGPEYSLHLPQTSQSSTQDQIMSPGLRGLVKGTFSFEKINAGDYGVYSGFDFSGIGTTFRHKAIFTPSQRLSPITKYKVYITGDENLVDLLKTGVTTRSVFDTLKGPNLGTGEIEFRGPYKDSVLEDTYKVKVTTAGPPGTAKFEWWRNSYPLLIHGPINSSASRSIVLEQGISTRFLSGTFSVGDTFSVVVRKPTLFLGNVVWEFETASGSIQTLPTTTSTSIIGDISGVATSAVVPSIFAITSVSPKDTSTQMPLDTSRILINFNKNVNASTVASDKITITAYPVNGDEGLLPTRKIYKNITVNGKQVILDI
jgi:hypothetical protein